MSQETTAGFDIGHPAPGRRRVGALRLIALLLAAPVAWSLQLAASSAIAGLACLASGDAAALDRSAASWADGAVIGINLAALGVAVLALLLSIRSWREAGKVPYKPAGGVMEAGEGRARLMAVWAIWSSVLFAIAIGFNTISVFWGELCPA